jgi:hypothetical protein
LEQRPAEPPGQFFSLRDVSIQCLHSSLVMQLTLRWWPVRMAILPFAQPPTFETLITLGSADMISFYQKAKRAGRRFQLHLRQGLPQEAGRDAITRYRHLSAPSLRTPRYLHGFMLDT